MKLTITEATLLVRAITNRIDEEGDIGKYWEFVILDATNPDLPTDPEDVERWTEYVELSIRNIETLEDLRKRIVGEYLS